MAIPTTVTPRPAHSEFKVSSRGISLRQGAHQVAQKLMTKDLSAKEPIEVGLPARFSRVNCGSRSGILAGGITPGAGPSEVASSRAKSLGLGGLASPAGTGIP